MSLRKAILEADDRKLKPYEIPEWGVTVFLRPLTLGQQQEIAAIFHKAEQMPKGSGAWHQAIQKGNNRLIEWCVCNEDKSPVFAPDDLEALSGKNGAVIQTLIKAIGDLAKMGGTDPGNV